MTNTRFDLGLAILSVHAEPGATFSQREIAAWCECRQSYVYKVERNVMKKIRARFLFGSCRKLTQEIL